MFPNNVTLFSHQHQGFRNDRTFDLATQTRGDGVLIADRPNFKCELIHTDFIDENFRNIDVLI